MIFITHFPITCSHSVVESAEKRKIHDKISEKNCVCYIVQMLSVCVAVSTSFEVFLALASLSLSTVFCMAKCSFAILCLQKRLDMGNGRLRCGME